MTEWLVWRLVKWVGLIVLGYGVLGCVWGTGAARRRAGLAAFPIGLLTVFVAGYGLLELRDMNFGEPWVSASLVAGTLAAAGAALHSTVRQSRFGAGLCLAGVLGSLGFMVFRDVGLEVGAVLGSLGFVLGAATALEDNEHPDPAAIERWFAWIGRAEGVSLLTLFGVAMPLKYGLGIPEVSSWVGWLHGVLFLLYLAGLGVGVSRLGWSLLDAALGFVAALLPFGTFAFERRITSPKLPASDG